MRLIDADKLENVDFSECMDSMEIMAVIDAQPTAYDVNKVLKELRESAITLCAIKGLGSLVVLGFDDVIEIVQKGGVEHEGNTAHRKEA